MIIRGKIKNNLIRQHFIRKNNREVLEFDSEDNKEVVINIIDVSKSGIGFECTGTSIAHGLQAGFHVLPAPHMLHGLGVGYCLLVQLIVQNQVERFEEIFEFCKDVGLPVCTADIGLTPENRDEAVWKLAEEVYVNRWDVSNVPQHMSPAILANAMFYLDAYAADYA